MKKRGSSINLDIHHFKVFSSDQTVGESICEFLHCFLQTRNTKFTFAEEPQMKIKSSMKQKQWYLIHTWLDKAIKGIAIFAWRVTYSPLKGLCLDIISRVSPIISVNVPFTLLSHQLKLCQQSLKCKRWYLKCFDFFYV